MKTGAGPSTLLKSRAAITIQIDYPCPLIAADSMSQSGMCIINQWLLFAPPRLLPITPLPLGYFQCKTGLWTIPSSVTKCTAQSLQDGVSPAIDKISQTRNEHSKGSNSFGSLNLSSLHIISNTHLHLGSPNNTLTFTHSTDSKNTSFMLSSFLDDCVPFLMRAAWYCNPALSFSISFWYKNKALQARQQTGRKFTQIQLPFIFFVSSPVLV